MVVSDFILFVEEVERQYPTATPGQIASEIRQIWFSDANWELLSAGDGISKTDIESEPNPIAKKFDMADLSPSAKDLRAGKNLIVAAHGNSLRAIVKHLFGVADDQIVHVEMPTGNPLLIELDAALKPKSARYLDAARAEKLPAIPG